MTAEHHDRHDEARGWLDRSLSGEGVVGFSWMVILAFVRLVTKSNLFPRPLTAQTALDRTEASLSSPAAVIVEPAADHSMLLRSLLASAGSTGNLVNDAHLAALSIEHRGRVVSYDSDFASSRASAGSHR